MELFENLCQNLLLKVLRERTVAKQLRETDDNLSENKGNKTKKGMKWKWRPSTRVSFSLFPFLYPKAKQRSERRGKGHNYCVVPSSPRRGAILHGWSENNLERFGDINLQVALHKQT